MHPFLILDKVVCDQRLLAPTAMSLTASATSALHIPCSIRNTPRGRSLAAAQIHQCCSLIQNTCAAISAKTLSIQHQSVTPQLHLCCCSLSCTTIAAASFAPLSPWHPSVTPLATDDYSHDSCCNISHMPAYEYTGQHIIIRRARGCGY